MAFLGKYVTDFVKTTISSISPYKIEELQYSSFNIEYNKYPNVCVLDERYILYKVANYYESIFIPRFKEINEKSKLFSLFRYQGTLADAKVMHQRYYDVLRFLEMCVSIDTIDKIWLEKVCVVLRANPNWTAAHVAAKLELTEAFRSNMLTSLINICDKISGKTPLHLAVASGNIDLVKEILLTDGVDLNIVDKEDNSIIHLAAALESHHILHLLLNRSTASVNYINNSGRSALHIACENKSASCLDVLLKHQADPSFSTSPEFPIHVAMRAESIECVKLLCSYFPDHILVRSPANGQTVIHMAKSKLILDALMSLNANINSADDEGLTALHLMVKENKFDMVFELLLYGADTNILSKCNETPLHFAMKDCDIHIIRSLIIFEVDVNVENTRGETARHILCRNPLNKYQYSKTRDVALYTLNGVGASRCKEGMIHCTSGCCYGGGFDGKPPTPIHITVDHVKDVLDETLISATKSSSDERRPRSDSKAGIPKSSSSDDLPNSTQNDFVGQDSDWLYFNEEESEENFVKKSGIRLLCLDGGGIRGLILTQTLRALEKVSNRNILDLFDWIGGTSTGGILAISIIYKMTLKECRIMYLKMKDSVFVGKRPYSFDNLEKMLKERVGEHTKMTAIKYPKLSVTALLCDRFPPKLHLFRNYDAPLTNLKESILKNQSKSRKLDSVKQLEFGTHDRGVFSKDVLPPSEQLVWEVAKATGAAPTFFRACGSYVDGGLIANNPTADMLTEITEYNLSKRHNNEKEEPLGIVVSIGTGRVPVIPISSVDVFRPNNPIEVYNIVQGVSVLTKVLVEMATATEGRVVDRSRAWCYSIGVPFFRFSPPLSADTSLDESDIKIILQMLWDTEAYLYRSQDRLKRLAELL